MRGVRPLLLFSVAVIGCNPLGDDAPAGPDAGPEAIASCTTSVESDFADGEVPSAPWGLRNVVTLNPGEIIITAESPDNSEEISWVSYGPIDLEGAEFAVEISSASMTDRYSDVGIILTNQFADYFHTIYVHNQSRVSQRVFREGDTNWRPCDEDDGCHTLEKPISEDSRLQLGLTVEEGLVHYTFSDGTARMLSPTPVLADDHERMYATVFARSEKTGSRAEISVRRFSLQGCRSPAPPRPSF